MGAEGKVEREPVKCPYCDEEILESLLPFCQACKVTVIYCSSCNKPLPLGEKVCPDCGTEVKG